MATNNTTNSNLPSKKPGNKSGKGRTNFPPKAPVKPATPKK
jgi:hypothetical protein